MLSYPDRSSQAYSLIELVITLFLTSILIFAVIKQLAFWGSKHQKLITEIELQQRGIAVFSTLRQQFNQAGYFPFFAFDDITQWQKAFTKSGLFSDLAIIGGNSALFDKSVKANSDIVWLRFHPAKHKLIKPCHNETLIKQQIVSVYIYLTKNRQLRCRFDYSNDAKNSRSVLLANNIEQFKITYGIFNIVQKKWTYHNSTYIDTNENQSWRDIKIVRVDLLLKANTPSRKTLQNFTINNKSYSYNDHFQRTLLSQYIQLNNHQYLF